MHAVAMELRCTSMIARLPTTKEIPEDAVSWSSEHKMEHIWHGQEMRLQDTLLAVSLSWRDEDKDASIRISRSARRSIL